MEPSHCLRYNLGSAYFNYTNYFYAYSPGRAPTSSVWRMKCGTFTLIPTQSVHWSSPMEKMCGVALGRPSQLSTWSKLIKAYVVPEISQCIVGNFDGLIFTDRQSLFLGGCTWSFH